MQRWASFWTVLLAGLSASAMQSSGAKGELPVIGILFLPYTSRTRLHGHYMMATYAKWVEQNRMRWIPFFIDDPEAVWKEKMEKVSGILLTGGGTPIVDETFDDTQEQLALHTKDGNWTDYGKWVVKTVAEAQRMNDRGIHKPVWGTCLGFESMMLALTDRAVHFETQLENLNVVLPVDFQPVPGALLSSVFSQTDFDQIRTEKTFYHNHHCGFMWTNAENDPYIRDNLYLHAATQTVTGFRVVACFEHRKYPFFGIQFHPEADQFVQRDAFPTDQEPYELTAARKFSLVFRNLVGDNPSPLTDADVHAYRKDLVHLWGEAAGEMYMSRKSEPTRLDLAAVVL